MSLKVRTGGIRKNTKAKSATKRLKPSVAAWVKRISGMIEGAPDLSSREGFGR